jgi:hypothetical protein
VDPAILAIVIGSLAAIKTALRCIEILVRAHADNLRERGRRETAMSILTSMQVGSGLITQGKCETITSEPKQ